MKGFMLSNPEAILSMDKTLSKENPKSRFIYPEIKAKSKSEEIEFKANSCLLDEGELESLSSYALALAKKGVDEILSGYVKPSPYKSAGQLPCEYCVYRKVCGIASLDYKTVREPSVSNIKDFYKGGKLWQNN